jgi:cell division protein FtsB
MVWGDRLGNSRWLLIVLGIFALGLQAKLWFADDGYQKTLKLRAAVTEQRVLNESLRARNDALDAEVINLKQGRDAAEERARTDLGMIGESETFYQVVPVADSHYQD